MCTAPISLRNCTLVSDLPRSATSRLERLDLQRNQIREDAHARLLQYIAHSSCSLVRLDLSYNELGPACGMALGSALNENATLQYLDLSWNGLGSAGGKAIAKGICDNESLVFLNVSSNGIGSDAGAAFGLAVQRNRALAHLFIRDNCLGLEGAMALADGLSSSKCLETIDLINNTISADGLYAVVEAATKAKGLQRLAVDSGEEDDALKLWATRYYQATLALAQVVRAIDNTTVAVFGSSCRCVVREAIKGRPDLHWVLLPEDRVDEDDGEEGVGEIEKVSAGAEMALSTAGSALKAARALKTPEHKDTADMRTCKVFREGEEIEFMLPISMVPGDAVAGSTFEIKIECCGNVHSGPHCARIGKMARPFEAADAVLVAPYPVPDESADKASGTPSIDLEFPLPSPLLPANAAPGALLRFAFLPTKVTTTNWTELGWIDVRKGSDQAEKVLRKLRAAATEAGNDEDHSKAKKGKGKGKKSKTKRKS